MQNEQDIADRSQFFEALEARMTVLIEARVSPLGPTALTARCRPDIYRLGSHRNARPYCPLRIDRCWLLCCSRSARSPSPFVVLHGCLASSPGRSRRTSEASRDWPLSRTHRLRLTRTRSWSRLLRFPTSSASWMSSPLGSWRSRFIVCGPRYSR